MIASCLCLGMLCVCSYIVHSSPHAIEELDLGAISNHKVHQESKSNITEAAKIVIVTIYIIAHDK